MATKPTTAPTQKPTTEGFFPFNTSKNIHDKPAEAAAVFVVKKAETAVAFAPKAEPALNPNQPNQSKPVPINTYGILEGCVSNLLICDILRFKTRAPARAAQPAEI